MRQLSEMFDEFGIPEIVGAKRRRMTEEKESFLPKDLVMVDLEMTGVVPDRDDILQIAMTKLRLEGNQYVEHDEPLEIFVHTNEEPSSEFHKEFLLDIFKRARASMIEPEDCKDIINNWLGPLRGSVIPAGDCVPTDISFLYAKGCIDRPDIVDGKQVPGTFNYEFFDLNAIKCIARAKAGKKEDKKALGLDEGIHNALVDCRNQTIELNYFLSVLLNS